MDCLVYFVNSDTVDIEDLTSLPLKSQNHLVLEEKKHKCITKSWPVCILKS